MLPGSEVDLTDQRIFLQTRLPIMQVLLRSSKQAENLGSVKKFLVTSKNSYPGQLWSALPGVAESHGPPQD